jgi:hypothetical protein
MSQTDPEEELSEERRRAIFLALSDAEDLQEMPRAHARRLIARRFGLSEARVAAIEHEGMEKLWPPL